MTQPWKRCKSVTAARPVDLLQHMSNLSVYVHCKDVVLPKPALVKLSLRHFVVSDCRVV